MSAQPSNCSENAQISECLAAQSAAQQAEALCLISDCVRASYTLVIRPTMLSMQEHYSLLSGTCSIFLQLYPSPPANMVQPLECLCASLLHGYRS